MGLYLSDFGAYVEMDMGKPPKFCAWEGCPQGSDNQEPYKHAKMRWCVRCKAVRYCNTDCQRAHWLTHSPSSHRNYCQVPVLDFNGWLREFEGPLQWAFHQAFHPSRRPEITTRTHFIQLVLMNTIWPIRHYPNAFPVLWIKLLPSTEAKGVYPSMFDDRVMVQYLLTSRFKGLDPSAFYRPIAMGRRDDSSPYTPHWPVFFKARMNNEFEALDDLLQQKSQNSSSISLDEHYLTQNALELEEGGTGGDQKTELSL